MNVLICGYGFVGMAHALSLQPYHKTHIYDPMKGYKDWVDCGAVIIAVSTPENKDGSCCMNNVYEVIERVKDDVPILIKSTISLEGWELINRSYPDRQITFSPEYLRAEHAMEDFKCQVSVSIGGGDTNFWSDLLSALGIPVVIHKPELLILTKYFRNSYLAMKVAFFNQIYDMAEAANINPHELLQSVSDDPRIGKSHTYVNDDERGYGGHCFPKDVSALLNTAYTKGVDLSILSEAMQYNERLRDESRNNV